MCRPLSCAILLVAMTAGSAFALEKDFEGGKDHPLVTRMSGYFISSYEVREFDAMDSAYSTGADARWEGRTTRIGYTVQPAGRQVSMTQIARNYEAAAKRIGGVILYAEGNVTCARIEKAGTKTYLQAAAFNEGSNYELIIVEAQAMQQEVVADAAALKQGLATDGKVALYGLFFDSGKAVVKPESEPTIVQVLKLLQQSPELKLFVVGHTDGAGTLDANVKLSTDRAAAVVAVLASRGADAGRLKPAGVGPHCPVATNRNSEGKAKNRRVELVERL